MQKIDHIDDLLEGKLGETERRGQTFPLCLCSVPNADITYSKWKFYLFIFIFYLFFSFIFISWRLTTLQYCSVFCHTFT